MPQFSSCKLYKIINLMLRNMSIDRESPCTSSLFQLLRLRVPGKNLLPVIELMRKASWFLTDTSQ